MIEIEILTSPDCAPCEVLKRLVAEVLQESGLQRSVTLKEVDVLENPDLVLQYGILSTPALVINGTLCFTGVPRRAELTRKITEAIS